VASAWERNDHHVGQHVGELDNHRGEYRGTLVARCKERWTRKCLDPCEVKGKLLRIAGLVQKRRCIFDQRLLEVGRELYPDAGAERHRLNELLGGSGMVVGSDTFNHGADPSSDFLKQGRDSGVIREQGEQRRLVPDKPPEEFGALARQAECDGRSKRVSGYPRWREPQVFD
jgi:hypothetical protein